MKALITYAITIVILLGSCGTYHTAGQSGKIPPGQAKKMSGRKSAREHAPGHRKKLLMHDKYYMGIIINENR